MNFNVSALVFWGFCSVVGYFVGDKSLDGALMGLAVGSGLSILAMIAGR